MKYVSQLCATLYNWSWVHPVNLCCAILHNSELTDTNTNRIINRNSQLQKIRLFEIDVNEFVVDDTGLPTHLARIFYRLYTTTLQTLRQSCVFKWEVQGGVIVWRDSMQHQTSGQLQRLYVRNILRLN
jgi:hypothetical protein